ncbi:hypothetical protein V7S43_010579 [Phytophthora oleae]|uniref:Uncharacterized protein n=1 Tax=Phytophthora oleae TaxID=2107226 RepID=A0ABD3FEA5_9STRA
MKSGFVDCVNPELLTLCPCSVCEREVHHVCPNDPFDPDNIAVHAQCLSTWKAQTGATSSDAEPVTFEIVGWATGASRRQLATLDSESTVAEQDNISSSQSLVDWS